MTTPSGSERHPRRGDIIQAAPYFTNGISGTVVSVSQGRISLDSPEHGRLQLPLARFTWKPKARVWICWPSDMTKHMKLVESCDEAVSRARFGISPAVGDYVCVDGKPGWIARKVARPIQASSAQGAVFQTTAAFEISLRDGNIMVESEHVAFDTDRRLWFASPPA